MVAWCSGVCSEQLDTLSNSSSLEPSRPFHAFVHSYQCHGKLLGGRAVVGEVGRMRASEDDKEKPGKCHLHGEPGHLGITDDRWSERGGAKQVGQGQWYLYCTLGNLVTL